MAPGGNRAIGDYVVGDQVLAALQDGESWTWNPQTVTFSSGSPAMPEKEPGGNVMIFIQYGDDKQVIASQNQLFMMTDGKLKRADQLVPGQDQLTSIEGPGLDIEFVASGHYRGAIHHIATSTPSYDDWNGSLDDHLLNVNGVIGGDYLLQLFQDTPKMQEHLSEPEAPTLGTEHYKQRAPDVEVKPFVVGKSLARDGVEARVAGFRFHDESTAVIPPGAFQLFTQRQEVLLMDPTIPKRGFSDVTNVQLTDYYAKIFNAAYPGVKIYVDWESLHPNVYAFEQYGQATVVVGGEFLRLGPLYAPAMAIALSFGVANRAVSADADSLGHSIYDGIGTVMERAFQGGNTLHDILQQGQPQLDTLLKMLSSVEQGSDADGLTAECISSAIDAAISGDPLPPCAGGPPASSLQLTSASYDGKALTIAFSGDLDPATALVAANYSVTPQSKIASVTMAEGTASSVIAEVALAPGDYAVTTSGIKAAGGAAVDPAHSSATFTVVAAG